MVEEGERGLLLYQLLFGFADGEGVRLGEEI